MDNSGNVYVADRSNYTIRKITPAGLVTTLAGVAGARGAADGTGAAARFNDPQGVAVDGSGNVYVTDNRTLRKITPVGVVTTLVGATAGFNSPITVDSSGNVYVMDNYTLLKITPAGVVTTLAGTAGAGGSTDGIGAAARFDGVGGVTVDSSGNLYVAEIFTVRKITPVGVVTTLAGTDGPVGSNDGTGTGARFYSPQGVTVDSTGNVYVADTVNHVIRKITSGGVVTTLAGTAGASGSADGTGAAARFYNPFGVAADSTGNVYVADTGNYTVRKITPAGVVTTLAGVAGSLGSAEGTGAAARFTGPQGVTVDRSGNVYVADTASNTIRKITPAGVVTTLAGSLGVAGSIDGTGAAARFNGPYGVTVDSTANVYVADANNHTIRKVSPAGVVTTLAGSALSTGRADGNAAAARFINPRGVTVDSSGNVYVADTGNYTIRKITPAGVVSTVVGRAASGGYVLGALPGVIQNPCGLAIMGRTLYFTSNNSVNVAYNLP